MAKSIYSIAKTNVVFKQIKINFDSFLIACKSDAFCDAKIDYVFLKDFDDMKPEDKNKIIEILAKYRSNLYNDYYKDKLSK